MANPEHLKIFKNGIERWNEWRRENLAVRPDLSDIDLREADLRFTSLRGNSESIRQAVVDSLRLPPKRKSSDGVNFRWTNLSGADFHGANLVGSDLTGANLCQANLREANISETELKGANLSRANLREAVLVRANLNEAEFTEAQMWWTIVGDIDLSCVKGLSTILHLGPSTVGIDTIYRSEGKIPEVFLRGVGTGDDFISTAKAVAGGIQFYSCFISYSSDDQEFAERLHADLQNKGVRCWFAPKDLRIGDKLRSSFDDAIRIHDKLMVLLSQHSIGSVWVEKEVETAFEKERKQNRVVLFPIRLDDSVMKTQQAWAADIRRTRHIGDFHKWKDHDSYKKAFERLLRDLNSKPQ